MPVISHRSTSPATFTHKSRHFALHTIICRYRTIRRAMPKDPISEEKHLNVLIQELLLIRIVGGSQQNLRNKQFHNINFHAHSGKRAFQQCLSTSIHRDRSSSHGTNLQKWTLCPINQKVSPVVSPTLQLWESRL